MDMLLLPDYVMDSQGLLDPLDSWNGSSRQLKRKRWSLEEETTIQKMAKHIGEQNSWEQVEELAADLDGSCSLSSLNVDLTASAYQNSDALLSLPSISTFKQELLSPFNSNETRGELNAAGSPQRPKQFRPVFDQGGVKTDYNNLSSPVQSEASSCSNCSTGNNHLSSPLYSQTVPQTDCRFQYVLAAATSIATKVNEETLTYLNQGQSYEIKLKKLGDLSEYRGKFFKSVVRLVFHERRLQFMEREQLAAWEALHPGDSILEVDLPLSYGILEFSQDPFRLNTIEFVWDPTKEVGIYIKVNCISTEFTPKKHGGEKGVPFRIQVETYLEHNKMIRHLHTASCQVKVFKLKGADRKHKQDREKIQRRPLVEQEKYQCSCDCTILTDVPLGGENAFPPLLLHNGGSSQTVNNGEMIKIRQASVGTKEEVSPAPPKSIDAPETITKKNDCMSPSWSPQEASVWLQANRYGTHLHTLSSFSGSDLLRLSRENLIQLCGLPDGIRLYNALHSRPIAPRLTVYFCCDQTTQLYEAVYLRAPSRVELLTKLANLLGLSYTQISSLYLLGPHGIRVVITDELVCHITDHSTFSVEISTHEMDKYHIVLKQTNNPSPPS